MRITLIWKRDKYDFTYGKEVSPGETQRKRGYPGEENKTISEGEVYDETKKKWWSEPFDKLSEKVVYRYLDKEDRKIRDKCLDTLFRR